MKIASAHAAIIEAEPLRRFQYVLLAMCFAVLALDGLDVQLLPFAAPSILAEWKVDTSALAPAMAAALFGMVFGNSFGGFFGDRFGRRAVLVCSAIFFGAMTMAMATAESPLMLTLIRFAAGIGFGAAIPNAVALAVEWVPGRYRTQIVGLLTLGVPVGGMLGAALASLLIDHGWRASFLAGGMLAICMGALLFAFLPESPGYLVLRGRTAEAETLLARAFGGSGTVSPSGDDGVKIPGKPAPLVPLFSRSNLRLNTGLFLAHFFNSCTAFLFQTWLTVLLTTVGMPLADALRGNFVFLLTCMIGGISGPVITARVGSRWIPLVSAIAALTSSTSLAILLLEFSSAALNAKFAVYGAIAGIGLFVGGLQSILWALASALYPEQQRATGIGLATGIGRAGGVTAILTGGVLLSVNQNLVIVLFGALSAFIICTAIGLLIIDRYIPPAQAHVRYHHRTGR